jgi:hypothetical protein
MKRLSIGVVAVVGALLLGTFAYGASQGYGPGNNRQVDVNAFRQFQKETLPLRDEVQAKGLELRNEYAKENPDQAKIAKLRGEIGDLRTKIQGTAEKNGLPGWGPGAGMGYGCGYQARGCGGWGHSPMMGRGHGRGFGGDCPRW